MKPLQYFPAIVLTAILLQVSSSHARFAVRPKNVPVVQLTANVEAHLKKNPKDAQGHYVLGRLHSMAFALRSDTVEIAEPFRKPKKPNPLPEFAPYHSVLVKSSKMPKNRLEIKHLVHLEASLRHYGMAANLDKRNARGRLGLAWIYEEAQGVKPAVINAVKAGLIKNLPKGRQDRLNELAEGTNQWEALALKYYREVLGLTAEKDTKKGFAGPGADSLMSQDASQGIERILKQPGRQQTALERKELIEIAAHLQKLGKLGRVVTPIIFPMDKPRPLASLLLTGKKTTFDLDGDGLESRWAWVKPSTGMLVWDSEHTGVVKDGRILFGSVTWWIFWNHGYEPMAMLDNNRNGWLEDRELDGLSVWTDRNSNGISELGEVQTVAKLGIKRLSCRPKGRAGEWHHHAGLEMRDGRRLPTYDWTPESIPVRD